ncbi:hypothetical protein [Streptomyces sp. DHE17-7]|uniref:hypothetical protein n=1 Tax=Streptomyces sp. DHE17-7 TaxID=2759949 RepID=UPI0022EA7CD2|nr:hypothetical protein [Streptomyces sp. DHE17-7]
MTTTTAERPRTRQRYRPTELDTVPAVNALLRRLGLGRLDAAATTAFGGRNDNWAGPTTTGEQVFVKTVTPLPDGTGCPELDRSLSFEDLAARLTPASPLRSPGLLGADPAAGVMVHRLVPGARSGAELALDGDFDDDLCRSAGRAVGTLHRPGARRRPRHRRGAAASAVLAEGPAVERRPGAEHGPDRRLAARPGRHRGGRRPAPAA